MGVTIMKTVSALLAGVTLAVALTASFSASAQDTIKIGEINSYSGLPSFTEPYRKGWQLALEQINAAGGVNGKKLEVISKDDGGKPADAVTAANELVSNDGVVMLAGTFFSNIGLAVSDFAKQKKILFLAAEPLTDAITLSKGNRYTFRLRPSNYEQAAMLAEEAAKLPAKKWATVAPNYEYGQSNGWVNNGPHRARSTLVRWSRQSLRPNLTPSLMSLSGPTSSNSCVKAIRVVCSRTARS
jgi:branched-chain amino acid transport system substrate-binding protein